MIAFFQTLRGKLILTYTTVTVLSLLALEVTVLLFVFVISGRSDGDTQSYLADVLAVLPPQARQYLQPGAQNLPGLQSWLQDTYDGGYASLPPQGLFDSPAAVIARPDPMYVLSPDGTVIAAAPAAGRDLVGRKYAPPAEVGRSGAILAAALGETAGHPASANSLSAREPNGNYLLAVPVTQDVGKGQVVAVIVVTVRPPPPSANQLWPAITAFIGIVLATGVLLLFLVAPFGAVFGSIMSVGLTRRLKALTRAADAWSEGDFSVQPQDRAQDEISYLGMRMRRMAENIQTLLHSQHELTLMEERNRLARELHDTVKQETFATLMQVRAAGNLLERDPAAARTHLAQAEELIKTSQQELGLLINELRPTALEGQGLAGALTGYLATWSQHSRIPAEFQVQDERRLPLETEQALFRVAQEALSNVARHSRASAATVRLIFGLDRVTLCIADNGVGFDPATGTGGFGLQSMRARMAALHGSLDVQPAPGGGVILTASAPSTRQEQ